MILHAVSAVDQSQESLFPSQSESEAENDAILPQVNLRSQLLPCLHTGMSVFI